MLYDVGLIGIGVIGERVALNLADHGVSVCVYNRTQSKSDKFVEDSQSSLLYSAKSIKDFISKLTKPRKILILIKAEAVSEIVNELLDFLDTNDSIIDAGNSHFEMSMKMAVKCKYLGINFIDAGVSGGAEGARSGLGIMAGGDNDAIDSVLNILDAMAVKSRDGNLHVGPSGCGHFCKMVHNGIEYVEIQILSECCHFILTLGFGYEVVIEFLTSLKDTALNGFLLNIFIEVFSAKDGDSLLLENVVDKINQNGTGIWLVKEAFNVDCPIFSVCDAVQLRMLSLLKNLREKGASMFPFKKYDVPTKDILKNMYACAYCPLLISYSRILFLMQKSSDRYGWNLDLLNVVKIWSKGCIISGSFLDGVSEALYNSDFEFLAFSEPFASQLKKLAPGWREVVTFAVQNALPFHTITSALSSYDGMRTKDSCANIIGLVRDRFGLHGYEKKGMPEGSLFSADWGI